MTINSAATMMTLYAPWPYEVMSTEESMLDVRDLNKNSPKWLQMASMKWQTCEERE